MEVELREAVAAGDDRSGRLRERKKRRTRQVIVEEALRLFSARGFDATTVEEIAEAAEISRRTFFRYFETKEAVLFANQAERLEAFRALLEKPRAADETPLQAVRLACLEMAHLYEAQREIVVLQNRIIESSGSLMAYDQRFDAQWEEVIAAALARDLAPEDAQRRCEAQWLAGALVGIVRVVLRGWFEADGQGDLEIQGRAAFDFIAFQGW